jgi:hypothetical protein
MTNSRVIHDRYRDSSPAAQNDRRDRKEARVDTGGVLPCCQLKRSPEIPPQWRTRHSTSTVISTVGSGVEKSHSSNGTRRNEAGDLGAQSLNSADTSPAIPACSPTRDDRAAGGARGNTFPPYTRHPERQRRISVSMVSEGKGSQYQWAGRRVPGPGMTGSRVIHDRYRDSSPAAQNDRRGRKEARVDTGDVLPCRQFKRSPEIPPQWRTWHSTSTVISTVGSAEMNHTRHGADEKEPRNLTPQQPVPH